MIMFLAWRKLEKSVRLYVSVAFSTQHLYEQGNFYDADTSGKTWTTLLKYKHPFITRNLIVIQTKLTTSTSFSIFNEIVVICREKLCI